MAQVKDLRRSMVIAQLRMNLMKRKFHKKTTLQQTSKFKSKLEEEFNKFLIQKKINFLYESFTISYLKPSKASRYTPDFKCLSIIFETKGHFVTADRKKHLLIKEKKRGLGQSK